MENLLNRGLKFAVLPLKLDLTQVLVDFRHFERSAIWKEFWHNREENKQRKQPIFKKQKFNFPKNYSVPEGLKTFLGSVKSELLDPRNRNACKSNLPPEEIQALKELIKLQRERQIIIKPCDKGAGIIMLNFSDYMKACYEHLNSEQILENGESRKYYVETNSFTLEVAKAKVRQVLDKAVEDGEVTKEEYDAMNLIDADPAKFYMTFKVHKEHKKGEIPPPRPIISGAGSIFENVGKFIEYHIKEIATQHESYLQDTPHFLRILENFKKHNKLKPNSMLVTLDVKALFTNITHQEGLESLAEKLKSGNIEASNDLISHLMEVLLKYNIFTFNEGTFLQQIGAPMGSPPVPSYANIFMATKIDPQIPTAAQKSTQGNTNPIQLMKRFLDDIFLIFNGKSRQLHSMFDELNRIHPTIKFTINHTSIPSESLEDSCDCQPQSSIPFLDTLCFIENNQIETDLYKKESDRNQYLLPSSIHPVQCCRNIPYSLGLRIVRICSKTEDKDNRFSQLKDLLLERGYKQRMIDSALDKARKIPRSFALQRSKIAIKQDRPIFAVTFDPRLPSIPAAQAKHWRAMVAQDSYLAEVFPKPPLTAFKRQRNLRDLLIRAKVSGPPRHHQQRELKGMKKCGKMCTLCPYVKEGNIVKIGDKEWKINRKLDCNSYNIIYLISCLKNNCKEKYYVGQSKRILKFRISDHRGYVVNQHLDKTIGEHFNRPGHSLSDLSVTALEQVKKNDLFYRREREKYFINKFNTQHKGMNKQK